MKKQVILSGGLGNQMFQYAFYLSLRRRGVDCVLNASMYRDVVVHQGFELQRVFGINEIIDNWGKPRRFWLRFLQKYHPSCLVCKDPIITYYEQSYHTKACYYFGYWMNEAYFSSITDEVRKVFMFRDIDDRNLAFAQQMKGMNSVSLHIRRGDYLMNTDYNVCTEKYYQNAINQICSKVTDPKFYIFSDDPDWCNSFMKQFEVDFEVVTHNRGKDSYKDMYLMTQCHHNIIANSTFSWWGAWLNKHDGKIVVAPSPWWNINEKTPVCDKWYKIEGIGE